MTITFKQTPEQIALIEAFRSPNKDKSEMAVATFFELLEPVLEQIVNDKVKEIEDEYKYLKWFYENSAAEIEYEEGIFMRKKYEEEVLSKTSKN